MNAKKRTRRPRHLRRQIAGTMVITAFVAVALFGALNYYAADDLLRTGTQDQLASVAQGRADTIESGTTRLLGDVSAMAADLGVSRALEEFIEAFDELEGDELDAGQLVELEEFYDEFVVTPINDIGITSISVNDVLPPTDAGKYVQYHYTLPQQEGDEPLADAGDGSTYSEVNAANSEFLQAFADTTGGDLLLISTDTGDIVFSTDKGIDVGTSVIDGPFSDSALTTAIVDGLQRVPAGESVMTDFEVYIPGGGHPVLFATAAVRSGTEVVGVLALQVPVEALNNITTAGGAWEDVGLGAGESYVVSSNLVLQSESRMWIEDPEKYLGKTGDAELSSLIEVFDSPVGIQPVDTEAVREALEGRPFTGSTKNYLDQKTFTSSISIDVPGVKWVVVTDVPLRDALQPLNTYLIRMAIVLLLILPSSALIGFWLAKRLTKPIAPAVEAALAVSNGEREPQLPPLGNDEFGDLGRRLILMAGELERQETALADEYESTRQLLLAVLPAHLVSDDGELSGTGVTTDTATVVAVSVDIDQDGLDADDDEIVEALATVAGSAEDLAEEHSLERIRVAADRFLFLSGARQDSDGADAALEFASALTTSIADFERTSGLTFVVHIGLSTGQVGTGVLQQGSLTFGAWGEPVRRALAIGALSQDAEILVDASTAGAAADSWIMESASHIVDLNDEPMRLFSLELVPANADG